jgi:hypothetical protein
VDADDRLRLDYDGTTQLLRTLLDVRFKLLAFVPTIAGTAVAFFGKPRPAAELMAVGLLGLTATLGIFMYELRNSQVYDAAVRRVQELERRLELPRQQPAPSVRLFGLVAVEHERGVALVYGAAFAGWTYLVGWGALRSLDVPGARKLGAVLGALAAAAVIAELHRIERERAE